MAPVMSTPINSLSLTPDVAFLTKNRNILSQCTISRSPNKPTLAVQKYALPLSTSIRLFPQFRIGCVLNPKRRIHTASASGSEVAVEEASPSPPDNDEKPSSIPDATSKRARPGRKSDMPPVKNEELVPGATFTGKVMSIQPFGAFVDIGAFSNGLVHVSKLSDTFVKDISSIVSVGQEVKVRLIDVNLEMGRISLSMRSDETSNEQQWQQRDTGDRSRPPPRTTNNKSNQKRDVPVKKSNLVMGEKLDGTVKKTTRGGAVISLPEDEEGFLPSAEEAVPDGYINMTGGSSLEVGQEVRVQVLRIARGQVTLTMKKEGDEGVFTMESKDQKATNPFVLAFRKNEAISTFLDEREKERKIKNELEEKVEEPSPVEAKESIEEAVVSEEVPVSSSKVVEEDKEKDEEVIVKDEVIENKEEPQLSGVDVAEEVTANKVEEVIQKDEVETEITDSVEASIAQEEEEAAAPKPEENEVIEGSSAPVDSPVLETESTETPDSDAVGTEIAVNEVEPEPISAELPENGNISTPVEQSSEASLEETTTKETPDSDAVGTEIAVNEVEPEPISAELPENGNISTPVEQSSEASLEETTTKATISPALVKQLREETGAGMMDCKKALSETEGDIVKAQEFLRKKGLASADKKASRATAEGRVGSYIHDSRIGVLIEVNCETDFVARGDIFKDLVEDLAMQVAACPQVQVLNTDDVPKEIVDKEREIEMQKEDLLSKPEKIRSMIVDGRIKKRLEELALLEQPFIKDDKVVVKDHVKQTISTIGENIKVKRFVRYNLGEGLEKKSQDFAAEVAAQTVAKPVSTPETQEPVEIKEAVEEVPKVAVSAALVKQLREETGAGMMDCKKALSETGGDLEKAQECLRKKGLSTADKKSSRIAAEGRVGSYIHDSRIGVLIEVNCETDFVGRSQNFKELVDDLAMQVAACPQVEYVSIEDIPESMASKEKEVEMQREDLQSKPESIREKIVEGRIAKRLGELALLEQPFIKNDTLLVKDLVKQTVATLGENIKVRRFVRFTLGESTTDENKSESTTDEDA